MSKNVENFGNRTFLLIDNPHSVTYIQCYRITQNSKSFLLFSITVFDRATGAFRIIRLEECFPLVRLKMYHIFLPHFCLFKYFLHNWKSLHGKSCFKLIFLATDSSSPNFNTRETATEISISDMKVVCVYADIRHCVQK